MVCPLYIPLMPYEEYICLMQSIGPEYVLVETAFDGDDGSMLAVGVI